MLDRRITAFVMLLVSCSIAAPSHAGLEGDVEQLKVVAEAHKANRDRIKTWQGTAEVVTRSGEDDPHRRLVEFAWDATSDSHLWRWSLDENASAEEQKWFDFNSEDGMFHDGKDYRLRRMFPHPRYKRKGGAPGLQLLVEERRGSGWRDRGNRYFHAREFLDIHGAPTIEERLMWYFREADNRLIKGSVSRDGDRVTLQTERDSRVARYVYDVSLGGNLVELTSEKKLVDRFRAAYDWEEVDGVWIPKSFESEHTELSKPSRTLNVTWSSNILNEPIPEGTFTIENIGVLPGDRVIDQINDTQSIYKEDELR